MGTEVYTAPYIYRLERAGGEGAPTTQTTTAMSLSLRRVRISTWRRAFSSTARRSEVRDIGALENRICPKYQRMLCNPINQNLCADVLFIRNPYERLDIVTMAIPSSKHLNDQERRRSGCHRVYDRICKVGNIRYFKIIADLQTYSFQL